MNNVVVVDCSLPRSMIGLKEKRGTFELYYVLCILLFGLKRDGLKLECINSLE